MQYSRLSQSLSLCIRTTCRNKWLKLACSRMGGQSPLQNSLVQCSAVNGSAVQYSTCSAVQCSTLNAVHAVNAVNGSAVQCLTVIGSEVHCSARNCRAGMRKWSDFLCCYWILRNVDGARKEGKGTVACTTFIDCFYNFVISKYYSSKTLFSDPYLCTSWC